MRFDNFSFGSIQIDGRTYEHDVIIDRGAIRKRKKKTSRQLTLSRHGLSCTGTSKKKSAGV